MGVDKQAINNAKISVITATYNAVKYLPKLIESLQQQTDKNFEWVVADGGSTDGTLELLKQVTDINIKITSQADFGIYDALNRAIKQCEGDYYVVAGADDYFYQEAIAIFRSAITESVDFIATAIDCNGKLLHPKGGSISKNGAAALIASHSIGLLIKKSLHQQFGFYSPKYPILADQLFILKAVAGGAKLVNLPQATGFFSTEGVSCSSPLRCLTEFFCVQVDLGSNKYWQSLLFLKRLIQILPKM